MSGRVRCESPPNNKKLRDDESTMVDSQSCMSWFVFSCPSARSPSGPVLQGPGSGKWGPAPLRLPGMGVLGWLVVCEGAQTQAGAIPSIDPIDQLRHQPQRLAPPTQAATYQSVKYVLWYCGTCRAFPAGPIRRLTSPVEFD